MPADSDMLRVRPGMLQGWILQSLIEDELSCVHIPCPKGHLVRVLNAEHDTGMLPTEMKVLMSQARDQQLNWLLIESPFASLTPRSHSLLA